MMSEAAYVKPNGVDVPPPYESEPVDIYPIEPITRRSQSIGALVGALATAQLTFQPVRKDQDNPYYHSKYADLSTVIAATQPSLAKNGLVVMQESTVDVQRQRVTVTTMLAHSSGEWKEHELTLPAVMVGKDGRIRFDAQSCGAAITYARRYSYQGIVGVAAELDDDANSAIGGGSKAAADDVAKKKLEAFATSAQDPGVRQLAKESLAKINAVSTAKDLEGTLKASLEAQKDDGLFDTLSGTVQQVRQMATSPAKGNRPYRKIALTIIEKGELKDVEVSAFDNFKMSDTTCFAALDDFTTEGGTATLIVERSGKYLNLKDIKQLGARQWDNRLGVVTR
jgi:hypothetical protein